MFFDDSERMWVERRSGSGFAFDIFDAEGRHVASVEAPERAVGLPPYVRGDRLYVVERDSLGVSYAVAYRIATR